MPHPAGQPVLPRRAFVRLVGVACVGVCLPAVGAAASRRLAFMHTHTGEMLEVTNWHDGRLDHA